MNYSRKLSLAIATSLTLASASTQAMESLGDITGNIDFNALSEEGKQLLCREVRSTTDQMSEQLPLQIDATTQLVGASALYVNGSCNINYAYVVSEKETFSFLQNLMSQQVGEDVPMDFVRQFMSTEEGVSSFKQGIRQTTLQDPDFAQLVNMPFVEAQANYEVIGETLESFTLTYGD